MRDDDDGRTTTEPGERAIRGEKKEAYTNSRNGIHHVHTLHYYGYVQCSRCVSIPSGNFHDDDEFDEFEFVFFLLESACAAYGFGSGRSPPAPPPDEDDIVRYYEMAVGTALSFYYTRAPLLRYNTLSLACAAAGAYLMLLLHKTATTTGNVSSLISCCVLLFLRGRRTDATVLNN